MLRSRWQTYICLRLMEGADVYQLAKNCCISVEMIEKHYAAHIKNMLDTTPQKISGVFLISNGPTCTP